VSSRRTLALIDSILEAGERNRAAGVLTIPVIHDALAPEEGLIAGLAEPLDGVFIRVGERSEGARGPLNQPLAELVIAGLRHARLEIGFTEHDGRVLAAFAEHPEPTGGLEVLLRLAEVLVSAEIDEPLAIVSYPLAKMDPAVAKAAWEMCGLSVADSPPGRLRTFVPVAVGEVSVARHCLAQNSVRFAIQQDRLIKRGRHTDLDAAVRQVLLRPDQPLVLFLGAGASASANVSTGDAIRDEALRDLVGAKPTVEELVEAFFAKLTDTERLRPDERDLTLSQFRQRLTLERVLLEDFHRLGGRDPMLSAAIKRLTSEAATALEWFPEGRKALHRLIGRLPRLIVATINFDQLVEHDLPNEHIVLARPEDFETHRQTVIDRIRDGGGPLPILKLHGTIEHVDTLVATIAQTEFGLPREIAEALDAIVAASDQALTWVWVGCSMRDVDLRIWLGNQNGAQDLNEWWVDPLPSQALFDYARYLRESQWASLGNTLTGRLITETADVFLSRLDEHASSLH
jgi:hypothetical protein